MGSLQIHLILLCHGCPVPLPEAREVGHGSRDHMLWLLWGWPLVSGLGRGQTLPGAPPSVGPAWFSNPGPWEVTTNLHIIKLYVLEFTVSVAAVWSGGWRGTLGIHRDIDGLGENASSFPYSCGQLRPADYWRGWLTCHFMEQWYWAIWHQPFKCPLLYMTKLFS